MNRFGTYWRYAILGLALVVAAIVAPALVVVGGAVWALYTWGRRAPEALGCLLYFDLLGPLFGFIAMWPMIAFQESDAVSISDLFKSVVLGAVFSVGLWLMALPLGAPPALLTGCVYWVLQRRASGTFARVLVGVVMLFVGACTSALWTAAILEGDVRVLRSWDHWLMFGLPGAIAAPLCALIVEWRVMSPRRASGAAVA